MEGLARGLMLPTEFNGPVPKKDGANTDGYPRNPRRANYFQKVKGTFRPGMRAAQVEPTVIEEPEASASLAEVATRDPDEGSGFVMGIYKVGAEVERTTATARALTI